MKKPLTYIFLPTEDAIKEDSLFTIDGNLQICKGVISTLLKYEDRIKPCHLYILSEDKIKEGDWFYNTVDGAILNRPSLIKMPSLRKIIATTNSELHTRKNTVHGENSYVNDVPEIHPSDIEYIISLYNGKDKVNYLEGQVEKPLDEYIKQRHTQEECIGFADGYNKCLRDNADNNCIKELISELKETLEKCLPEFKTGIQHVILRASAYLENSSKPKTDTVMVEYEEFRPAFNEGEDMDYDGMHAYSKPKLKDGCIVVSR